jgi:ATP-dependent DNA helicase DinG
MPEPSLTIEDILGPDGLLARSLDGYEFRPSQMDMARRIDEALTRKLPALVEAGTGTGKTFGYLVPLILSGKKAVISTGTKNLQEQVYFKDIPLLQKATGLKAEAVMMKGRKNYLCLYRYHQYAAQKSFIKDRPPSFTKRLQEWVEGTSVADRAEIAWLADDDSLWDDLSCTSDQCLGGNCPFFDDCFLNELRRRAARAMILIVNHHLFFADLKIKKGGFGEIIPRFQAAVFDEAHNVEEIATTYLGESISTNQLSDLAVDLDKALSALEEKGQSSLKARVTALRAHARELRRRFEQGEAKARLDPEALSELADGTAGKIRGALKDIQRALTGKGAEDLQPHAGRAAELDRLMAEVLKPREQDWLTWYERGKTGVTLHASPLDISERLNELLYGHVETVAFTSATLSTNGNFDYIKSRLGLHETVESIFPSHFDFSRSTLLYIPRDLPLPGAPQFATEIAPRILDILERTGGRALVLFTSHHNLNTVYALIKDRTPYLLQRQGDAPKSVLLEAFRENVHSVLLATGSFWQGVDVPGESLSCVIVDKLPFDSPADPLVAARIEAISARGGNSFLEFQVPSAIISLKQGLGRLIRKGTDRGILSVLDIRILNSRYGKFFIDSLPGIPITHDLGDINRFFEKA